MEKKYLPPETITFLGIRYDKQLTFTSHAEDVAKRMKLKSNILARLSETDWGHDMRTPRSTYVAIGRAIAEYAAAAWHPWMSSMSLEKLEPAQRHAGKRICGLLKTTPKDDILMESDLPPMKSRSMQH